MPAHVTTVSTSGFASTTDVREFAVDLDPSGDDAPDTIESLLASYGACFIPALRVAAEQRDVGDLGGITIDVTGELDDDGKLTDIAFAISTEAALAADERDRVVDRAFELCKVHAAIRPGLHATVTFDDD